MEIIKAELNKVKEEIKNGFLDPLDNNALLEFINGTSKRIRSILAILYLKAHDAVITDEIYSLLAAGELIHDASLLQDDILDDADIRRGKTSIAKEISPKISLLAADYLLTAAMDKLLKLNNKEILEIFKDCIKKMSIAEIKQYSLRGRIPKDFEYLDICKDKTGALFSAILMSAAVLCNLEIDTAGEFGCKFGTAFQILNDLDDNSAAIDNKNKVVTAKSIFGVEKTQVLLDNYQEEMRDLIRDVSNNFYKKSLEEIVTVYGQIQV